MWLKKTVAILCAVMLVVFGGLTLSGCGSQQSPADTIRDNLAAELDSAKNLDAEFTATFVEECGISLDEFEDYGITSEDVLQMWFSGFDYAIDEVVVDEEEGTTATATLTLTCKSYQDLMNAVTDSLNSLAEDEDAVTTTDDLNTLIGETMTSAMEGVEPVTQDPTTLDYTLEDDTWTCSSDLTTVLVAAMLG